jgi:ABC-type transport system involved in multi-copper enzyme maturation permease subunit
MDRAMGSNPIIRFELIRAVRRRRHYAMRAVFGLLLLYVAWALYAAWDQWAAMAAGPVELRVLRNLPRIADLLVLELLWMQGVGILLVVPGLVAGSIAEEDRRGTMLALLASPLSSGSIVLGKLAARLAQVGVALAIGLPVVIPLALLGALDLAIVARAHAMLLSLALFVGSLALLVAVVVRSPRPALLWAHLVVGGWLLMPAWLGPLAGRAGWPFGWLGVLVDGMLWSHPVEAARNLWRVSIYGLFHPVALAWAWSGFSRAFPRVVGTQLAGSVLFLIAASLLLRPRRLEAWRWGGREPAAPSRPAVGDDDPVLWKERYAHRRLSRRAAWLAIGLLVVLVVGPLIEPAAAAFREWRASWWAGAGSDWRRGSMNQTLRQLSAGLYLIGLVAAAAMGATSVAGERERGTWAGLEMTLVTGREVARAKVSGALRAVRGLMIPFAVLWSIGLATGSVHPLGVLASAVGLFVFLRYGAALGVLCSMISPTSGRAMAATAAILFAGNAFPLLFVPLDLIGQIAGMWQAIYLAGVTPFVEWIALVSPVEIRWYLAGQTWDSALGLPGGVWGTRVLLVPGLIRTYLAGLVLHALAASAAIRAAAWAFDAKQQGCRLSTLLRAIRRAIILDRRTN